jgi:hypothetical protein
LSEVLASKAEGDALLWFAYPSTSAIQVRVQSRAGWCKRSAGFDTVRQIAIDEDWSALRFRRWSTSGSSWQRVRQVGDRHQKTRRPQMTPGRG